MPGSLVDYRGGKGRTEGWDRQTKRTESDKSLTPTDLGNKSSFRKQD